MEKDSKYEDAIQMLNKLQLRNPDFEKLHRDLRHRYKVRHNPETIISYAKRIGLTLDALDKLSIIHVSGTKGKGSVCAFCESILLKSGLKVGFHCSPHLVEVRERIRINGKSLSRSQFADYFLPIFNQLECTKPECSKPEDSALSMPNYTQFLTLMAYHVFLEEKVDVAIMEVNVGGAYDCTNIHRCPTVVGITSLDIDHTTVLGDTIKDIAWHKAGICKVARPAFTVQQPDEALMVIRDTAASIKVSSLQLCPDLTSYDFSGQPTELGLSGLHQHINASLALQLCKTWMEEKHEAVQFQSLPGRAPQQKKEITNDTLPGSMNVATAQPFLLPDSFIVGLKDCYWPARNQTFTRDGVTYYIDAAHNTLSMKVCQNWFEETARIEAAHIDGKVSRVLIFNVRETRDPYPILKSLVVSRFDGVVFCPSIPTKRTTRHSSDETDCVHGSEYFLNICERYKTTFEKLLEESAVQSDEQKQPRPKLIVLECIQDALQWAACNKDSHLDCSPTSTDLAPPDISKNAKHIQVLATGSVRLVGGVIKVLNPGLVSKGT